MGLLGPKMGDKCKGELALATFADSFASLAVKSFNRKGRKVRKGRTLFLPAEKAIGKPRGCLQSRACVHRLNRSKDDCI